jgi:hypothetical protein
MEIEAACQLGLFVEDSNPGTSKLIYERLVTLAGIGDRAQLDGRPDGPAEVGCKETLQRCHRPLKDSWTDLMPYTLGGLVDFDTHLENIFL